MSIPAILGITPTDQATTPEFTPGAIGAVIR
jgi:hypothetical protein